MEREYLMDTNCVIDYLDNKLPPETNHLIDHIDSKISVITRMELLSWPGATQKQTNILKEFISASEVFTLDESIITKSIEIRKKHRTKLPDAIIAGTAVVNNLTIITRNTKDFINIHGLVCIDPYKPS